jgi:hypothetical protein
MVCQLDPEPYLPAVFDTTAFLIPTVDTNDDLFPSNAISGSNTIPLVHTISGVWLYPSDF